MAKYEINYTCGHTSTVQLFGKCSERERKIEWMERQECPECRRKREAEEAVKVTEGLELPELEGSEKQVAWAKMKKSGIRGKNAPAAAIGTRKTIAAGICGVSSTVSK